MEQLIETYKRQHEPVVSVKDKNGCSIEIHRCKADGALVFNTSASLRLHAGHHLQQPVFLTDVERILLEQTPNVETFIELTEPSREPELPKAPEVKNA